MGYDPTPYIENKENRYPVDVRDENFGLSLDRHEAQNEVILRALYLLKEAGASKIYNHLNETTPPELLNNRGERFPLQSIRRALTNLASTKNDKEPKIIFVREEKSQIYDNSTECIYKPKQFKGGLF